MKQIETQMEKIRKLIRNQTRMLTISLLLSWFMNPIALAYNDSQLPQIVAGEPGTQSGEIILPITVEEMAAWCDFTKTIIFTNRGFLCVFNGKPVPGVTP